MLLIYLFINKEDNSESKLKHKIEFCVIIFSISSFGYILFIPVLSIKS